MEKHVKMIEAATQYSTAVYLKDSSYYIVTKFLEKGIAFLDKNRQMFLPFLGLRLQNNTNTAHEKIHEKFTPLMQLVFLWILYQNKEYYEQSEIAAALDISGMTVLRTLNFFVQNSLMSYTTEGKTERKKVFHLIRKKSITSVEKNF